MSLVLTLTAAIRECPPDHKGGYDLARKDIVVTAEDYDTALAEARSKVPEGWQMIGIMVDRGESGSPDDAS